MLILAKNEKIHSLDALFDLEIDILDWLGVQITRALLPTRTTIPWNALWIFVTCRLVQKWLPFDCGVEREELPVALHSVLADASWQ
jgi:hypothetical protein